MGRTTNITISTNPRTKTHQTQTIWFGGGDIRLNGETGAYIGEYAKDGGWWNAEVHFAGEARRARYGVQTVSPPLTTATQAAQAVAWAWHACKALEGFAAAAAPVLEFMEQAEYAQEYADYDREYKSAAEEAENDAATTNDTAHSARPILQAGFMYILGEFSVLLDEDTKALKVIANHPSKHLEIRPKTDNSVEITSCR